MATAKSPRQKREFLPIAGDNHGYSMAKPDAIELGTGELIPILYEDRSVMAIDKPRHWMLVPYSWNKTDRNLHLAIDSSLRGGHFWARSRNLKFLRHIHRLDADTTGILLMARSPGALDTYGNLFESRQMEKKYWAVVEGIPKRPEWSCRLSIGPDLAKIGRMKIDTKAGKEAETHFKVLKEGRGITLIEATPTTGRTHQIRIHLAQSGYPVIGDVLYGKHVPPARPLGLRAVFLGYRDPFTRRKVQINAPTAEFLREFELD